MADYRSILDRTIAGLSHNTEAARRTIYEKARAALMRQLSSLQPTLSPAEISKQRLQLEEAIRETERRFSEPTILEEARGADSLSPPEVAARPNAQPLIQTPQPTPEAAPAPSAPAKPNIFNPESARATPQPTPDFAHHPGSEISDGMTPPQVTGEPIIEQKAPHPATNPLSMRDEPSDPAPPSTAPQSADSSELAIKMPLPDPQPDEALTVPPPAAPMHPSASAEPEHADLLPREPASEIRTNDSTQDNLGNPVSAPSVNQPDALDKPLSQPVQPEPLQAINPESASASSVPAADIQSKPLQSLDDNLAPLVTGTKNFAQANQANAAFEGPHDVPPGDQSALHAEPEFSTFEAPNVDEVPVDEFLVAPKPKKKSRKKSLAFALILLIVAGAGAFGWVQRDVVGPVLGTLISPLATLLTSDDAQNNEASPTIPQTEENELPETAKSEDRVPATGEADDSIRPGERVRLPDSTPSAEPVPVPSQDSAQQQGELEVPSQEANQPATDATQQSNDTQASDPVSVFASRAILYEERAGSNQPDVAPGNVQWELIPTGSEAIGSTGLPSVKGKARIESRDMDIRFELMRNLDPNLPASHLIELEFTPGPLFNGDEINNIAGVVTKPEEEKAGEQLKGAIVKVSERVFWVAMSAQAADLAANTDALLKQNWLDIPLILQSGKRAILTLEKGTSGTKAMQDAFNNWQ